MEILVICDCYPSKENPAAGAFIKEQVRELNKYHKVLLLVIGRYFKRINISTVFGLFLYKVVLKNFKDKFVRTKRNLEIKKNEIRDGSSENCLLRIDYPVFMIGNKPFHFLNRISSFFCVLIALKKKGYIPDIIHAHKSFPAGYVGWKLKKWFRVPVVVTEHQSPFSSYFSEPCRGRAVLNTIRNVDKTFCVSNFQRDVIAKYGIPNDLLKVLYNGIDITKFCPDVDKIERRKIEIKNGRIKLLLVGTLEKRKGINYLIDAVNLLRNDYPLICLSLVGFPGDHTQHIFGLIKELRLEDSVSYLGVVPNNKLPEIINEHDILVSSSLDETFGVVIIEAMACGKPVVVTRSGGPEEFIIEKVGILTQKENSMALAKGIKFVINNYFKYDPCEIREHIIKNFSQDIIIKEINRLYQELVIRY